MAEQTQFDIFVDVVGEVVRDAEQAQERRQFGKIGIEPRFMQWLVDGDTRTPEDVDGDTFRHLNKRDRSLELNFNVDIQEFKPELEFTYENRRVMVGSTDWWKILKPSIEAVCGKGSASEANLGKTMTDLRGKYVEVADVLQSPTKRNPDPEYKTIKLIAVFDSREECYAASVERYGGGDGGELPAETDDFPEGWDAESWAQVEEEVYTAIEALPKAPGPRKVAINKLAGDYAISAEWIETQL